MDGQPTPAPRRYIKRGPTPAPRRNINRGLVLWGAILGLFTGFLGLAIAIFGDATKRRDRLIGIGAVWGATIVLFIVAVAISGDGGKSDREKYLAANPPRAATAVFGEWGNVIVQIGGGTTDGFEGAIGDAASQRSVQGVSPATFGIVSTTGIAVAVIQSKGVFASSPLTVVLTGCSDGHIHRQSTSADYGVVTVSC